MDNLDITEVTEVIEQQSILSEIFTRQRVIQLVISLIIIAIAIVVWVVIRRTYRRLVRSRQGLVPADGKIGTITSVVLNVIKGIIILIVVILVLEINGVKVTSLLAGVGIASAIIGLALQDYLKDVIMGAHIISDDFFQVGDVIRYGTTEGVVTGFNLRATKLQNLADGSVMTISNRNITEIVKLSNQLYFDIPLSYEEHAEQAQEVLQQLCQEAQKTIEGIIECGSLGVAELQDSSVIYKIKLICPPERKLELKRKLLAYLYAGVNAAGLQIPYAQMDVHMK
ncbi:MAG: mechanosensitive ion channel family protein [Eubacterium sp.]|nr:mechanosensitive ion channel family protein [Eubacterium sp.]